VSSIAGAHVHQLPAIGATCSGEEIVDGNLDASAPGCSLRSGRFAARVSVSLRTEELVDYAAQLRVLD
jgi:hypothetical protein